MKTLRLDTGPLNIDCLGYGERAPHNGSAAYGGLHTERSADHFGTIAHDSHPQAGFTPGGDIETAAVVADGQHTAFLHDGEPDGDAFCVSMLDRVGHRF